LILGGNLIHVVLWCGVDESLQGDIGIALESPDQKTRGFVVQIVLPWCFFERAHQVFGEMSVRI
jgi:hypothetical protein